MRLSFAGGEGGIAGWSLRDTESEAIDGLSGTISMRPPAEPAPHPNGAIRVDHLVLETGELQRTIDALETAGIALRRIREPDEPGPPLRQGFFRLGEVIVELAENPRIGNGPPRFWGITFCVVDIEACSELLGPRLGEVRDAVQPGRRIATVRRAAGLGVPVALISPELHQGPPLRPP